MNQLPVITLVPQETHYRKAYVELLGSRVKNWVHPFVESLSDCLVETLEEALFWINDFLEGKIENIKGPSFIHEAMHHYNKTYFSQDLAMVNLTTANSILKNRIALLSKETDSTYSGF